MTDGGESADDGGARRTEYALDRTVLANERTYTAWIRTGLAALAAGVAIERFLIDVFPAWSIRTTATLLIVFSAVAFALSAWRYTHLGVKIAKADVKAVPTAVTTAVSLLLILCSLLALAGLWFIDGTVPQ